MLLTEAIQGYMMDGEIERQSPRNLELKRQRLGYFTKWCEKQSVTTLEGVLPNTVRAFVVHLQSLKANELNPRKPTEDKPLSPMTIKGYVTIVRAFFAWCMKEGLLTNGDPTKRLPRIRIPHYVIVTFAPEQVASMIDACDLETPLGYRDYTLLLVLLDTGIRISELCGLTLDNVHEDYLTVFGKGSKEREVGLGPTAARALWKYIHQYRTPHDVNEQRVFLGRYGLPMNPNSAWHELKKIGMRAGIEGTRMSPHTFRHTFARAWLENGGEVFRASCTKVDQA
jgi:site-specific recombinase XerD